MELRTVQSFLWHKPPFVFSPLTQLLGSGSLMENQLKIDL